MKVINKKTRITASVLGVLLGMSGMLNHGLFEILQGNTPTNGYFIEAIGEAHRYWILGTFPGQDDPDIILNIVFAFLFTTVTLACITFISAYARDIEEQKGMNSVNTSNLEGK